jgi:predicted transcriptional regulator
MTRLPDLIRSVHSTLTDVQNGGVGNGLLGREPAVPVKKSITPDAILCLEDGRPFKSLKRHLRTKYGLSPDEYRAKWGLPPDYPMVAPNYAKSRSLLAKKMGLGVPRAPREEG